MPEFPMDNWRHCEDELPFRFRSHTKNQSVLELAVTLIEHQSDTDVFDLLQVPHFAVLYWN